MKLKLFTLLLPLSVVVYAQASQYGSDSQSVVITIDHSDADEQILLSDIVSKVRLYPVRDIPVSGQVENTDEIYVNSNVTLVSYNECGPLMFDSHGRFIANIGKERKNESVQFASVDSRNGTVYVTGSDGNVKGYSYDGKETGSYNTRIVSMSPAGFIFLDRDRYLFMEGGNWLTSGKQGLNAKAFVLYDKGTVSGILPYDNPAPVFYKSELSDKCYFSYKYGNNDSIYSIGRNDDRVSVPYVLHSVQNLKHDIVQLTDRHIMVRYTAEMTCSYAVFDRSVRTVACGCLIDDLFTGQNVNTAIVGSTPDGFIYKVSLKNISLGKALDKYLSAEDRALISSLDPDHDLLLVELIPD